MNKKLINRRNFLKIMGSFSLGILLLPLEKFLKKKKEGPTLTNSREAKFYTSSDHLAG